MDPLPDDTSSDLKLIISMLLNKDKDSRPTIFEVAKIPCISKKIEQYVEQHNCQQEVMQFFDINHQEKEKINQEG